MDRRACKEAHDGLSSTVDGQRVYVYVSWSMLLQRGLEVTCTLLEGTIIMYIGGAAASAAECLCACSCSFYDFIVHGMCLKRLLCQNVLLQHVFVHANALFITL